MCLLFLKSPCHSCYKSYTFTATFEDIKAIGMSEKVFCIGVNKTGTSSLHQALQILGYNSVHYLNDKNNNIKAMIEKNYLKVVIS